MISENAVKAKKEAAERIRRQVEDFKAKGNAINVVPPEASAYDFVNYKRYNSKKSSD